MPKKKFVDMTHLIGFFASCALRTTVIVALGFALLHRDFVQPLIPQDPYSQQNQYSHKDHYPNKNQYPSKNPYSYSDGGWTPISGYIVRPPPQTYYNHYSPEYPATLFAVHQNRPQLQEIGNASKLCRPGPEVEMAGDFFTDAVRRAIGPLEPVTGILPNATIDLPEYNLLLFLHSGTVSQIKSVKRKPPAFVKCYNGTVSLKFDLHFDEIRIQYQYRLIKDWHLVYDGDAEIQVVRPKSQIQISETTPDPDSDEEVQHRVEMIRLYSIGKIRIMIRGLGNLTQSLSMILTGYVNNNIHNIMKILKPRIEEEILPSLDKYISPLLDKNMISIRPLDLSR